MPKIPIISVIIFISLLAGAYYYFSGNEYVVRLTETELQRKLEEKLPLTKTYLLLIQVTLNNPRVHLESGSNRVSAGMDVVFNLTINENSKPLGGTVDASGEIVYVAKKGEFFLSDPVIESIQVQGIPDTYTEKVNKALSKAMSEYYKGHPIFTLSSIDMKQRAAKMILKGVSVEDKELVVTLGF